MVKRLEVIEFLFANGLTPTTPGPDSKKACKALIRSHYPDISHEKLEQVIKCFRQQIKVKFMKARQNKKFFLKKEKNYLSQEVVKPSALAMTPTTGNYTSEYLYFKSLVPLL